MKHWFSLLLVTAFPTYCFSQVVPPPLGAASSFALFTAIGAFDNVGPSIVHGDIGTNAGAFSGFPLGVVFGNIHVADTYSTQAATDVQLAFGQMSAIPCVVPLGVLGGTGGIPQVLTPNAYCLGGATTFAGELVLDAQGDPSAVFFIRVSGALTTGEGSVVTLINGASASNVYWQVTGRTDLGHNSVFQGTLIADGAINLIEGASLQGHGLSRTGAITMDTNLATLPVETATVWLSNNTGTLASREDWYLASNWSQGVPTALLDAYILSGRPGYPVLTAGTAVTNSLILGTSASLTQNGGTLEIHNDFTNSGTLTTGGGTIALAGTDNQLVGGSSLSRFWNLTVGATGATLAGTAQIQRMLTLDGNLLTSNQPLTLLSSTTGTGLVANSGGTVVGAVTMERYISPQFNAGPGYRHLSSPMQATTLADLTTAGFTPRVNPTYNTNPGSLNAGNFPNVFFYNEARPGTVFEDGWQSPVSVTETMAPGMGYTVNISGGTKPDFTGTLTQDDVLLNLSRTGTGTGDFTKAGWHLIGNPFPSLLDWDLVTVPVNMTSAMSVFRSTSQYGGSYQVRTNGVGGVTEGLLAANQGFFVRVISGTTASLTLPNSARPTDFTNVQIQRTATETRPLAHLSLHRTGAPVAETDESFVYFEQGATLGLDAQFDAQRPGHNLGNVPTLSSVITTGEELAVNGLPPTALAAGTAIELSLALPVTGTYTLASVELLNLSGGAVNLRDRLTNTVYDLTSTPSVSFAVSQTGQLNGRFALEFGARVLGTAAPVVAAGFTVFPNPANGGTVRLAGVRGTVEVRDVTGRLVATTVADASGAAQLNVADLTSGVYVVRAAGQTQRLIIQ